MSAKKKVWTNKKYGNGKRVYTGNYSKTAMGERIFEVSGLMNSGSFGKKVHTVTFESATAAKNSGWIAK